MHAKSTDTPAVPLSPRGSGHDTAPRQAPPPIDSSHLLAGASEVRIVHRGVLYRLKQTALGKLILTK